MVEKLRPELKDSTAAELSEDQQLKILEEVYKREGVGPPLAWDATEMSGIKWNIKPPERAARLRARLGLTDVRPLEFLPGRTSPEPAPATKRRRTSVAKPTAKKSKKKRVIAEGVVSRRRDKRPRVVDAPQPPPKRVAVGARVVWEGLKGVVEAEVAPGEFTIRFDYGGVQHEVRAEELS